MIRTEDCFAHQNIFHHQLELIGYFCDIYRIEFDLLVFCWQHINSIISSDKLSKIFDLNFHRFVNCLNHIFLCIGCCCSTNYSSSTCGRNTISLHRKHGHLKMDFGLYYRISSMGYLRVPLQFLTHR